MLKINTVNYPIKINETKLNKINNDNANNTHIDSYTTFRAIKYNTHPVIRTQMTSKDEQNKYNELTSILNNNYKNKLNLALKSGKLLNNISEDNSTVLDNLYKIYSTPRAKGLDNKIILEQSLDILANPYIITQVGEDVPKEYRDYFI